MSSRILSHLVGSPWAITQDAMDTITAIADREFTRTDFPETIDLTPGHSVEGAPYLRVRNHVGLLGVSGPLFRYGNLFTEVSGATSVELLTLGLGAALEDPEIRSIVLQVDSPGGEANGVDELAELIYQARQKKPVIAHISGRGASGAYWLASAASEVVVTPVSLVGSIGAILTLRDYSGKDKDRGIRDYEFVSSVSPNKAPDPTTQGGRDQIQEMVDDVGMVFVEAVAKHRGISPEEVQERYGAGAVLVGRKAVEAGMADRMATLEELLDELEEDAPTGARSIITGPGRVASAQEGTMDVDTKQTEETFTRADLTDLTPDAVAELIPSAAEALRAEGREQGAVAERTRIEGIRSLYAPGFEDLRAELIEEGVSVEEASLRINTALRTRQKDAGEAYIEGRRSHEGSGEKPKASAPPEVADKQQKVNRILTAGRARQTA
jgi:capsid assembly protease